MFPDLSIAAPRTRQALHFRWLLLPLLLALAPLSQPLSAGVFGDGNSANGEEDDRLGLSESGPGLQTISWYRSAGTIHCDGAVRGSATLLDVTGLGLAAEPAGLVIVTAAHVLVDLDRAAPWVECFFDYMGLGELPGYRALIHGEQRLLGSFNPTADPSSPEQGRGDWAFLWLGPDWRPPGAWSGLRPLSTVTMPALDSLALIAWDRGREELSLVAGCRAVRSVETDIGGGAWPEHWLDDCDSDVGASGGALVSLVDGRLLAIRGGSHWDPALWPADRFPAGPPAGTRWDVQRFTNYARGVDEPMLRQLRRWLGSLPVPGEKVSIQ